MSDQTDSKTDLVSRAAMAAYEHDFSLVSDEAMGAAIAIVLDDLAEPSEEVASAGQDQMALEPYGPDGIWHAMLAAKRKELGL